MQSLILKKNGKESANIYLKDTSYTYIWTRNDADIASSSLTTFLRVLKLKLAASMFFLVRHSFLYNVWRMVSLRAGHQANSPVVKNIFTRLVLTMYVVLTAFYLKSFLLSRQFCFLLAIQAFPDILAPSFGPTPLMRPPVNTASFTRRTVVCPLSQSLCMFLHQLITN